MKIVNPIGTVETWKKIPHYNYEVSDMGRVRNFQTGKIKAQFVNNCGYHQVSLGYRRNSDGTYVLKNGKRVQYQAIVSRLVGENFVPVPQKFVKLGLTMEDLEINHLDENKSNNAASNLDWDTRMGNINYGTRNTRQSYYATSMPQSHREKLSEAAKRRGKHENNGKKVGIRLTAPDGTITDFISVREAARFLNVNPSRLHYNAKSGGTIDGYTVLKLI